ncbi:MAG: DUF1295 domain-containing protein [Clostridia bacterium]|nr:DUF1295 domain-containing protein [Clostridia bacterium]
MKLRQSRPFGFALLLVVYLLASALGIFLYAISPFPYWLSFLIADVLATGFVYLFSSIFENASIYDPYWSVAPMVVALALLPTHHITLYGILLTVVVILWGVRLTANFAYNFTSLEYQDWRYTMLEEKCGAFYPFINLFGIHIVPTLVVYLCMLPVAYALEFSVAGNALSYILLLISLVGVALEGVADVEMHIYRRNRTTPFIRLGIWKHARHPNYLGEILMWWGIGLSVLFATSQFWMPVGALANTALFLFVSIPMADKRQARKEGFVEYKAQTRSLFPIPKK